MKKGAIVFLVGLALGMGIAKWAKADDPFYVGGDTSLVLVKAANGDVYVKNVPRALVLRPEACVRPPAIAQFGGTVLCCCRTMGGGSCCAYTTTCVGNFVPGCFCSVGAH